MKKILMIFVLMSALFSQGNDRYGTYISTWFDALMMATDTTFNGIAGGQYMQDGRGNLSIFSVDGTNNRIGFGKLSPAYTVDILGTLFATTVLGDGSGLTGIASGTGGITNTGSTTIGADTDIDGVGEVVIQTRGVTRITVKNLGDVVFNNKIGIGFSAPLSALSINGGVHIGGESDAGDNNLLVDGTIIMGADARYPLEGYSAGRNIIRRLKLTIENATTAGNYIKITGIGGFNASNIAVEDDILQGTPGVRFDYDQAYRFNIQSGALDGIPIDILSANILKNSSGTSFTLDPDVIGSKIRIAFWTDPAGSTTDLDLLVDTGTIEISITYITIT